METSQPLNPYEHLSVEELTELRYIKQERHEQFQDMCHDAYQDWALVMAALKTVTGIPHARPAPD